MRGGARARQSVEAAAPPKAGTGRPSRGVSTGSRATAGHAYRPTNLVLPGVQLPASAGTVGGTGGESHGDAPPPATAAPQVAQHAGSHLAPSTQVRHGSEPQSATAAAGQTTAAPAPAVRRRQSAPRSRRRQPTIHTTGLYGASFAEYQKSKQDDEARVRARKRGRRGRRPEMTRTRRTNRPYNNKLPPRLERLLSAANLAFIDGKYAQATRGVEEVIRHISTTDRPYRLLALIAEAEGNLDKSFAALGCVVHNSPRDAEAWKRLGVLARELGRDDVWKYFKRAWTINKSDSDAGKDAIEMLLEQHNYTEALRLAQLFRKHNTTDAVDELVITSRIMEEKGFEERSVLALQQAVELAIQDGAALIPQPDLLRIGFSESIEVPPDSESDDGTEEDDVEEEEDDDEDGEDTGHGAAKSAKSGKRRRVERGLTLEQRLLSGQRAALMLLDKYLCQGEWVLARTLVERLRDFIEPAGLHLDIDFVVRYGVASAATGNTSDTDLCFSHLIERDVKEYADLYALVAYTLYGLGKYSKALRFLLKMRTEARTRIPEFTLLEARCQICLTNRREATARLESALSENPDLLDAKRMLKRLKDPDWRAAIPEVEVHSSATTPKEAVARWKEFCEALEFAALPKPIRDSHLAKLRRRRRGRAPINSFIAEAAAADAPGNSAALMRTTRSSRGGSQPRDKLVVSASLSSASSPPKQASTDGATADTRAASSAGTAAQHSPARISRQKAERLPTTRTAPSPSGDRQSSHLTLKVLADTGRTSVFLHRADALLRPHSSRTSRHLKELKGMSEEDILHIWRETCSALVQHGEVSEIARLVNRFTISQLNTVLVSFPGSADADPFVSPAVAHSVREIAVDAVLSRRDGAEAIVDMLRSHLYSRPYDMELFVLAQRARDLTSSPILLHNVLGRLAARYPSCVGALAILGQHALTTNMTTNALNAFHDVLRVLPDDPLVELLVGVAQVLNAMGRRSENRHSGILLGIAHLSRYQRLRCSGSNDADCDRDDSATSRRGDASGGPDEADSSSAREGAKVTAQACPNPSLVPLHVRQQESHYNLGRAFHHADLVTMAELHYRRVFECRDAAGAGGGDRDICREAAFNLAHIYRASGNDDLAEEIIDKYLVY